MMLERINTHTIEKVTSSRDLSISGPGLRPTINMAPSSNAMAPLPGMPKARVGIRSPPRVELFAAPGPSRPSTAPLPARDLSFSPCTA